MTRYEGMEDLLQRVRDRLGVLEPLEVAVDEGLGEEQYASMLETVLLVVRDTGQLRAGFTPERLRTLTPEQREDLLSLVSKSMRELWSAKTALERAAGEE